MQRLSTGGNDAEVSASYTLDKLLRGGFQPIVRLDVCVEHVRFYHHSCFRLFALLTASLRACFSANAFSSFLLSLVLSQPPEASTGRVGRGMIIMKGPAGINVALVPLS